MKELYKVRNITISLLNKTTHEPFLNVPCEFGIIFEREGIIFFETHIFNDEDYAHFNYDSLSSHASSTMFSFDNVRIEIPNLAFTELIGKDHTVIFRCLNYIRVFEEDAFFYNYKNKKSEIDSSQLLRIDLWGLDLLINPNLSMSLIVGDAPFEMNLCSDEESGITYIKFPYESEDTHNTLNEGLFDVFRSSLMGYLSLINGARVQITKEYYNGFRKLYSYDRKINLFRSYYTCGSAKYINFSPILFEFDNYVRWNNVLNLNKFVYHMCSAQQISICEDKSFILILTFEGLCKKYLNLQSEEKAPKRIISKDIFKDVNKELFGVIDKHIEIPSKAVEIFKNKINYLNSTDLATKKFGILLDDLNIIQTKEIKNLTKKVRSTLVHDAVLENFSDYVLLSELIQELILRLICSKIERHPYFDEIFFSGEAPNLPFQKFVKEKKLILNDKPLFEDNDKRIKLRITNNEDN